MKSRVNVSGLSYSFRFLSNALRYLALSLFVAWAILFMAGLPGKGRNQQFFAQLIRRLSSQTPIDLLLARILPPLDRWWFRLSRRTAVS